MTHVGIEPTTLEPPITTLQTTPHIFTHKLYFKSIDLSIFGWRRLSYSTHQALFSFESPFWSPLAFMATSTSFF